MGSGDGDGAGGVPPPVTPDTPGPRSCWLSLEGGLLYAFVGPAAVIVLVGCPPSDPKPTPQNSPLARGGHDGPNPGSVPPRQVNMLVGIIVFNKLMSRDGISDKSKKQRAG